MQFAPITFLAVQLALIQYLPRISCQFTFTNNNAPVPARFLVPGAFATPAQNQPAQNKRLLSPPSQPQQPVNDEATPKFRKTPVTRTRSGIGSTTRNFALDQESVFADRAPKTPSPQEEDSAFRSETAVDSFEDQTEETFSAPLSTFEPTSINTVPLRTFRPSYFQPRPTKAPSAPPPLFTFSPPPSSPPSPQFFRPNNNLLDESDEEKTNLEASPSPVSSTEVIPTIQRRPVIENTVQQFSRKPASPVNRVNNLQSRPTRIQQQQPQTQPTEFTDNKIVRQYEKVPAKTKFEKPEVPEKRAKKPVAQVLRRYREDNPDGSITWGFENDDGSYKEETIGNDCITRGKYGYIDPDGVRREYSYSQGLACDKTKNEQEDEEKPAGYIDYARNKVVLANGESVDIDSMVKNRQRKPSANLRN